PRTVAESSPSPPREERVGERRPYLPRSEPGSWGGEPACCAAAAPDELDSPTRWRGVPLSPGERAGVRGKQSLNFARFSSSPSVTASISGLSLCPLQASQNCGLMKPLRRLRV